MDTLKIYQNSECMVELNYMTKEYIAVDYSGNELYRGTKEKAYETAYVLVEDGNDALEWNYSEMEIELFKKDGF